MGFDSFYAKYVKIIIGFIISLLFVIIFCWLYLIIGIVIKITCPKGPILFKQDRIGKNGKIYKMLKFRTMYEGSEKQGLGVYSNDNDQRITKFGLFLRKTSLDELPQLFNIINGNMSLIGFRSPLTYHPWNWEDYSSDQKFMFNLRPGMTGWAQVNGRRTLHWDKRIELNCWYAKNVSFKLDVKIFFLTIARLFTGKDNQNLERTI